MSSWPNGGDSLASSSGWTSRAFAQKLIKDRVDKGCSKSGNKDFIHLYAARLTLAASDHSRTHHPTTVGVDNCTCHTLDGAV